MVWRPKHQSNHFDIERQNWDIALFIKEGVRIDPHRTITVEGSHHPFYINLFMHTCCKNIRLIFLTFLHRRLYFIRIWMKLERIWQPPEGSVCCWLTQNELCILNVLCYFHRVDHTGSRILLNNIPMSCCKYGYIFKNLKKMHKNWMTQKTVTQSYTPHTDEKKTYFALRVMPPRQGNTWSLFHVWWTHSLAKQLIDRQSQFTGRDPPATYNQCLHPPAGFPCTIRELKVDRRLFWLQVSLYLRVGTYFDVCYSK